MKKKVMVLSDYEGLFTGFARWKLSLLEELYKTNKYDLVSVAMGVSDQNPEFARFPWKMRGVIPNNQAEFNMLNSDQGRMRAASYGDYLIERIVQEEKPDVILAAQDSWGCLFLTDKNFYPHIPTIISVTFDSLPLLQETIDKASKIKHYWSWNQFAVNEFKRLGINHVECWYPGIDLKYLNKFSQHKKNELRDRQSIPRDKFGILFVFRNQLRKLVNKLIEGYAIFKKNNPEIKNTYLHLHTSWHEGWDIPKLAKQYGVPMDEIYATYVCRETREYFVRPFQGEELNNPKISTKKTVCTVDVKYGVTEEELAEIFNLNNLYLHPATSGATEIPIVQAAACEMIVSTCAYSFGDDVINLNKGSIPLDFSFYTEHGTQFLKSNPHASSIAKVIKKVHEMRQEEVVKLGKLSREWALNNYDAIKNAKKISEFIDNIPQHDWNFDTSYKPKNSNYPFKNILDDVEWLKDLYKNILFMNVDKGEQGLEYWINELKKGVKREDVYRFFIQTAMNENAKNNNVKPFDSILDNNGKKRILLVLKESAGDIILATSLFKSIKDNYPEHDIYFACDPVYFDILAGNPFIYKTIPYTSDMENELAMTGVGDFKGYFNVYINLSIGTQKVLNYLSNNKIALNLTNKKL